MLCRLRSTPLADRSSDDAYIAILCTYIYSYIMLNRVEVESGPGTPFVKAGTASGRPTGEKSLLQAAAGHGVVPLLDEQSRAGSRDPAAALDEQNQAAPKDPAAALDAPLMLKRAACSLADVLHERGPLTDQEVRAVASAAARALARVHEAGLVHGDVKPANLLLSHESELWLCDFDAAVASDGQPLRRFTPGRLPPNAVAWPETDIAALAITLIEMATGVLVDPGVTWSAAELRQIGCSAALSTEIALVLSTATSQLATRQASAPNTENALSTSTPRADNRRVHETGTEAEIALGKASLELQPAASDVSDANCVAALFDGGDSRRLPAPVARARLVDPTPTIDFLPTRRLKPPAPDYSTKAPKNSALHRLIAAFTPRAANPTTTRATSQRQRRQRRSSS